MKTSIHLITFGIGLILLTSCNVPDLNVNVPKVNIQQPTPSSGKIQLTATNSNSLNSFVDGYFSSINPIAVKIPEILHVSSGAPRNITAFLKLENTSCKYSNHKQIVFKPIVMEIEHSNETNERVQAEDDEHQPRNLLPENQQLYLEACSDSSIANTEMTVYEISLHIDSTGGNDSKVEAYLERIN